jgi:hypothetical protein
MTVEDQLRAAGRAVSEQVRDLPRLDLQAPPAAGRARARAARHWPAGWLVPVAAAVAVVMVAVTLVAVRTLAGPAGPGAGQPGPATSAALASLGQVPPYYAAITKPSANIAPTDVTIAATATGKALFTVKPPQGTAFSEVTAAADDRTFVLAISQSPSSTSVVQAWDLLRVSPDATSYTLRRLPIPALPGTMLDGLALSPDGTKLAVMSSGEVIQLGSVSETPATLRVYSVRTGLALHTWQTGSGQSYSYTTATALNNPTNTISWLANGHELAFSYTLTETAGSRTTVTGVGRLDLNRPGTGLIADSTPVVQITGWRDGTCSFLYPTADGKSALCGTVVLPCKQSLPPLAFKAYSGVKGSFGLLYTVPAKGGVCVEGTAGVLWASRSGSALVGIIVSAPVSSSHGPGQFTTDIGVLADGRWTPLPIHLQLATAAQLAF